MMLKDKQQRQEPKDKYRVKNWSVYNAGLIARGDVTIWMERDMWHRNTEGGAARRGLAQRRDRCHRPYDKPVQVFITCGTEGLCCDLDIKVELLDEHGARMTLNFFDGGKKDDEWIFECMVDFDPDSDEESQVNADIIKVAAWCNEKFGSEDAYVVFERISRYEMFSCSTTGLVEVEDARAVRVNVAFKKAEDAVFFKLSWGND
jgi:hypothetical protein